MSVRMQWVAWGALWSLSWSGLALAQDAGVPPAGQAQAAAGPADAGVSAAPAAPAAPLPTVEELVKRIEALEKSNAELQAAAAAQPAPEPEPSSGSNAAAFVQNAFNPDLSVIGDVSFAGVNVNDAAASSMEIPGFLNSADRTGKLRGINFNYLEMALNAPVDPFFDFAGVVTFLPSGTFDIEEVYIDTRSLPGGFRVRLGKFLSAFGRINGQHQHYWSFFDDPLVYEELIGIEGLKQPGVRVSWTAPVDFLLEADAEVLQGVDDESPTFNAVGYSLTATDGTVLSRKDPFHPALYVGALKTSFDSGDNVFLLGASAMYGHSTQRQIDGRSTDFAFYAPGTVLYDFELTYKYLISSYRDITWQSEYLGRVSNGELALASDGKVHPATKMQGGFYSQLVWRFDVPGQWRAGLRFDLLTQNSMVVDGVSQPLDQFLPRYTAMIEYSPSEFSRFRLEYNYDRSRYLDGARTDVHEVLLEVNLAVGPHGAHSF